MTGGNQCSLFPSSSYTFINPNVILFSIIWLIKFVINLKILARKISPVVTKFASGANTLRWRSQRQTLSNQI